MMASKMIRSENKDFLKKFVNQANQINNAYKAASFQTRKVDDYIDNKRKKLHVLNQRLEPIQTRGKQSGNPSMTEDDEDPLEAIRSITQVIVRSTPKDAEQVIEN